MLVVNTNIYYLYDRSFVLYRESIALPDIFAQFYQHRDLPSQTPFIEHIPMLFTASNHAINHKDDDATINMAID